MAIVWCVMSIISQVYCVFCGMYLVLYESDCFEEMSLLLFSLPRTIYTLIFTNLVTINQFGADFG